MYFNLHLHIFVCEVNVFAYDYWPLRFLLLNLFCIEGVAQLVKNPPATKETLIQFLGWEDPLEKG